MGAVGAPHTPEYCYGRPEPSAREQPPAAARRRGARTVEINRDPTPISGAVDWSLLGKAGEILPELVRMTFGI